MNNKFVNVAALIALSAGLSSPALAKPAAPAPAPAPAPATPAKPEPKNDDKPAAPAAKPQDTKTDAAAPKEVAKDAAKDTIKEKLVNVIMQTSQGDVVLELNAEKAPISVANFLAYMNKGHYDGTIFHRVIDGFMIQGGGFTADMKQKETDKAITNEWKNGLKNTTGTIAMARLGGNPDSATCQFFINVKDNAMLDAPQRDGAAYAVFGRVISGMDVVNKIKALKTGTKNGMGDVPLESITITKVRKATEDEMAKAKK